MHVCACVQVYVCVHVCVAGQEKASMAVSGSICMGRRRSTADVSLWRHSASAAAHVGN